MPRSRLGGSLRALVLLGLVATAGTQACDDPGFRVVRCNNIPEGGCPAREGSESVPCQDRACAATYLCVDGRWREAATCPLRDGGPQVPVDAGSRDADALAVDAPSSSGCRALQPPDCDLAFAAACLTGCCSCEDVFTCQRGEWSAWGRCVDDAFVASSP